MRLTVRALVFLFIAIVLSSPIRFAYAAEPLDPIATVEGVVQQTVEALTSAPLPTPATPSPQELQSRSDIRDARGAQIVSVTADAARAFVTAAHFEAQQLSNILSQTASAWSSFVSLANADFISRLSIANTPPHTPRVIAAAVANAPPGPTFSSSALPTPHLAAISGASSGRSNSLPSVTADSILGTSAGLTSYVSQDELSALANNLRSLIYQVAATDTVALTNPQIAANGNGVYYGEVAAPITQLNNVPINGLTASEIPDLSGSYLSTGGGTITGTLNVSTLIATTTSYTNFTATLATTTDATTTALAITGTTNALLSTNGIGSIIPTTIGNGLTYAGGVLSASFGTTTANNWTALQQFQNASTSLLSVYGPAYFGATATSSFASNGALTLSQALAITSGGTGWNTINSGSLLFGNGSSALATSSNLFWDSLNNRLGIGTSSPAAPLELYGSNSSTNLVTGGGIFEAITNTDQTAGNFDSLSYREVNSAGMEVTGTRVSGVFNSHVAGAESADLAFLTRNSGTLSEKMRILGNGNVGIGTTSPFSLLTVAGQSAAQNFDAFATNATSTFSGGVTFGGYVSGLTTSEIGGFSYATSTNFVTIAAWGDSLIYGTEPSVSFTSQLSQLTGYYVYNGGENGDTSAQIEARMVAANGKYGWPSIIWAGRNDITGSLSTDEPTILSAIASMVSALQSVGNSNYIVLSITNTDSEPSGSTNYNEIISINGTLASTYGSHYLDLREYLVQNGLSTAGLTPSATDLTDESEDIPPASLRWDGIHFNVIGNLVIAKFLQQNIGLLVTQPVAPPIVTTSNLTFLFQNPPTFAFVDSASGYSQNGLPILQASSTLSSIALGQGALNSSYTGTFDTALGPGALANVTTGGSNTAVGYFSLNANTTGNKNVGIGAYDLADNTTGTDNIALGFRSLFANTTGTSNVALGDNTLSNNTTGTRNVGIAANSALINNLTGSDNVAIGNVAENDNQSPTSTVAVGSFAANGSALYSNQGVVAIGYKSGFSFQTGSDYNTVIGYQAGFNLTTGSHNIFIGAEPTAGNANISTGSQNIGIGYNIALASSTASNQLDIGNFIYGTGLSGSGSNVSSAFVGLGTTTPYARLEVWGKDTASSTLAFNVVNNASTTVLAVFDGGNAQLSGTLTQSSDQRLKTNIQSLDASSSLSLIDALNPVTFNWIDSSEGTTPQLGFIAQQVQQIFPNLVSTTSPTALTPDGTLGLNYIGLIAPIVKAVQALYADVESLEQSVTGFAQKFTTNQLCVNKSDGTPVCVTGDQLSALLAAQGQPETASSSPAVGPVATTPPTIAINGDNPTYINFGDTYSDLGATVTGPQADLNLGIKTFLNGALVSNIVIDTSTAATDTIDYVATDQNGLTSTSTRTVIIETSP
jgi:lysophospholipase L1-like esterase